MRVGEEGSKKGTLDFFGDIVNRERFKKRVDGE